MDIRSKLDYPAGALSNFALYKFTVDDIDCASMEGFVQSLKERDPVIQAQICQLVGIEAKRWGETHNDWKESQLLWWKGLAYDRHSQEYQDLLDRAYAGLFLNSDFREALRATGDEPLTHSIGHNDPSNTVLTEYELCSRLMNLRELINEI